MAEKEGFEFSHLDDAQSTPVEQSTGLFSVPGRSNPSFLYHLTLP